MNSQTQTQIKVAEIIKKRQTLADKIKKILTNWEDLKSTLETIDTYRQKHSLGLQDFSTSIIKINEQIDLLKNLTTRLSRNTLNIGMVGAYGTR
jgi:hypothetical protein